MIAIAAYFKFLDKADEILDRSHREHEEIEREISENQPARKKRKTLLGHFWSLENFYVFILNK